MCLGEPYELHFYEHRYRLLIADVMRGYPEEAKHGGHIQNPPCFVHANRGPLAPTTPATLVQVVRCEIFPDGRADVLLMPTAVRLSLYYSYYLSIGRVSLSGALTMYFSFFMFAVHLD